MNAALGNVTAVLLAGGFGTRIKHLLPALPKPMAPAEGRPFLEWIIRYLRHEGVSDVVLSTGYRSDVIERHFTAEPLEGVTIRCSEETEPKGTAGGFLHAIAGHASNPSKIWMVANGDSLVLARLAPFCAALEASTYDAALLAVPMDDASRYGTLKVDANGRLIAFQEKRPGSGLINAGVYLFRAGIISAFPRKPTLSFETDVFPALLASGARIGVHPVNAPFIDIGTPDTLAAAESFIRSHRREFGEL